MIPAAEKLVAITSDEVSREIAWVQAIMTAPYSASAQFGTPEEIAGARRILATEFPFVRGFWHYARGIGAAASGDVAAAEDELAAIDAPDRHRGHERARGAVPARAGRARHRAGRARRADRLGAGDLPAAEAHLREAVTLQDGIGYMEPPYWYYPVRQSLGAVLLAQGRRRRGGRGVRGGARRRPA